MACLFHIQRLSGKAAKASMLGGSRDRKSSCGTWNEVKEFLPFPIIQYLHEVFMPLFVLFKSSDQGLFAWHKWDS